MRRYAIEKLRAWKEAKHRQPLLITGARQVGKTWLMKEFAKNNYDNFAYFSLDDRSTVWSDVFSDITSPDKVILALQALSGVSVSAKKTLIIFDEIQEYPKALTSLKYFNEQANDFHVMAAGSTLGVLLHQENSFPVGKVQFMSLKPLNFREFLIANNEEHLSEYICADNLKILRAFHEKLLLYIKQYMYVGGMPEVVNVFRDEKNFQHTRNVQNKLLQSYAADFSKYASSELTEKLQMVWRSVPSQLAKENKKFIYGVLKHGARAKEFENAIQWLIDSSIISKVHRVNIPEYSLRFHEDFNAFKLYLEDIGLFCAMANVSSGAIVSGKNIFNDFKGALAEQFAYQELRSLEIEPIDYWSSERGTSEIDFLTQDDNGNVVPIEVKSGINLRSKSLKAYMEKFKPRYAIRISLADFKVDEQNQIIDIPIYAINTIPDILRSPLSILNSKQR